MKQPTTELDLIPFVELSIILRKEFKASAEEIRYWIKRSLSQDQALARKLYEDINDDNINDFLLNETLLSPYLSDIPLAGFYQYPDANFFYPECYFYDKQQVLKFVPAPHLRFVYQKDLTAHRNWNDYKNNRSHSLIYQTLFTANEKGMLRLYSTELDEFTINATAHQLWCHTFEGESYFSNPDSFYLLYEILNIERIFFKKDRNLCLEELQIKSSQLPPNVYKFKKKASNMKDIEDE